MRNRLIILFLIVVGGLAISTVVAAQRGAAPEVLNPERPRAAVASDKH